MRIITLNTWGGRAGREKLLAFFNAHKDTTDIFCLQEIWAAPYFKLDSSLVGGSVLDHSKIMESGLQDISATLQNHRAYFHPHFLDHYGLLVFVRNGLEIFEEGEVFVHKYKGYVPEGDVGNHARNIQYVTIKSENGPVTVINFHGLWNGQGKGDSDDRLMQSDAVIQALKSLSPSQVLCGDFNLLPETKSLKKLEAIGLRNLIKEYGIISTRTSFYTKPDKYADYVLVKGVEVKEFKVLPEEVSDHAALYLEIV